jgi:hypothetical protein
MPDILESWTSQRPALNAVSDAPAVEPAPAAPSTPVPATVKSAPDLAAAVARLESLAGNPDQAAVAEAVNAVSGAWGHKVAEAAEQHPDFKFVVEHPGLAITPQMATAMLRSENPAEVAYRLGKNPAEALRIAQMPAGRQAFEIGRLADTVKPKAAAPARQHSTTTPAARRPREEGMEAYFTRRTKEIQSRRVPMFGTMKGGLWG